MRKLAHIEIINKIEPVFLVESDEPASGIELATVLGWKVVVKKGEYQVGDKTVFIETDAIVPDNVEAFAFLAAKNFKVKTMKLSKFYYGSNKDHKVVSQGLCVKLDALGVKENTPEGADLTKTLNITKVPEITLEVAAQSLNSKIAVLQKRHWFMKTKFAKWLMKFRFTRKALINMFVVKNSPKRFPAYIIKTDETRIQALPATFEASKNKPLQVTEKLDGTSTTFGLSKVRNKYDFAVCSRNVRQADRKQKTWYLDAPVNYYWEMADKYNIEEVLKRLYNILNVKSHIVLQGETMGPSIQSNLLGLTERHFFAFNLVVDGKKMDSVKARELLASYLIEWVPILNQEFYLPDTIEELLDYATGNSVIGNETLREGLVIRDADNSVSFKAVSREWLLKYNR